MRCCTSTRRWTRRPNSASSTSRMASRSGPPHSGVDLGRDVEAAVDGECPVGPPVGLVRLQPFEELVGPGDDAFPADPWDWPVDLEEAHADVETETPVRGEGHHPPGVDEQLAVALVQERDVLLDLGGDVPQRFVGERGGVAVPEVLLDAEDVVAPQPFVGTCRAQLHLLRVGGIEFAHEGEHRVPGGGGDHVGGSTACLVGSAARIVARWSISARYSQSMSTIAVPHWPAGVVTDCSAGSTLVL